jgi:hypothetical protein
VCTAAARFGGCRTSDQDRHAKRYDRCMFHVGPAGLPEFFTNDHGRDNTRHRGKTTLPLRYTTLRLAASPVPFAFVRISIWTWSA